MFQDDVFLDVSCLLPLTIDVLNVIESHYGEVKTGQEWVFSPFLNPLRLENKCIFWLDFHFSLLEKLHEKLYMELQGETEQREK